MKKTILLFFAGCIFFAAGAVLVHAQARIHIGNDAYFVIDDSAFLVIGNPNPNAITIGGGGANIVSESENDRIRWEIGPGNGNYIIPWTTANGIKIPLSVNLGTGGTGAGHFVLSTHTDNNAINNWDNFDYRPSDVLHMWGAGIPNNSPNVIDRFWRIEHQAYTAAPQAVLTFAYDDGERTAAGNTIPAGALFAQRYDNISNQWLIPGVGTDNHPVLTVTGASVPSNFFKSWTLSYQLSPLPSPELLFSAIAREREVLLNWDYEAKDVETKFVLRRASDGLDFEKMGEFGSKLGQLSYRDVDKNPFAGIGFYQLEVIDRNGGSQLSEIREVYFGADAIVVFPNPSDGKLLQLRALGFSDSEVQIMVYDARGRRVHKSSLTLDSRVGDYAIPLAAKLSEGIYSVVIGNEKGILATRKWLVRK